MNSDSETNFEVSKEPITSSHSLSTSSSSSSDDDVICLDLITTCPTNSSTNTAQLPTKAKRQASSRSRPSTSSPSQSSLTPVKSHLFMPSNTSTPRADDMSLFKDAQLKALREDGQRLLEDDQPSRPSPAARRETIHQDGEVTALKVPAWAQQVRLPKGPSCSCSLKLLRFLDSYMPARHGKLTIDDFLQDGGSCP